MPTSETALADCRDALIGAIKEDRRPDPDGNDIQLFRRRFLKDFEKQLDSEGGAKKWENDRTRVTALARAIGSLAEFFAIAASEEGRVTKKDLDEAFGILGPHCKREAARWQIRAEYCQLAQEEESKEASR